MSRRATGVAALACACLAVAGGDPAGERWWRHICFLADDKLEGRLTGSEGHRQAAAYVAGEFEKAGLLPAGTNAYIQPVKLQSRRILEKDSSLALVRNGAVEPLVLGEEAYISTRVDPAPSLEAPLVFVGYGLVVPEMQPRRLRRARSPRKDHRLPRRRPFDYPRPAALALPVGARAQSFPGAGGRGRHGQPAKPEGNGYPVGSRLAQPVSGLYESDRSRARRIARRAPLGHLESGARGQTLRREWPHIRRSAGAGGRRQGATAIPLAGLFARQSGGGARRRRIAERGRDTAGIRPRVEERIRRHHAHISIISA